MSRILCKEIDDYIQFTIDNPDSVSEDVHLLIKNVVLPTLERDDVFFDEETFHKCIQFCEKWFYPLFPFQKFRYAFLFMYFNDNRDTVYFAEEFDLMGRGNGKDGYVMPAACFMLTPMYGVHGYNIDVVATSEDQAIDSFDVVWQMLEDNKKTMRRMFYWNKTQIINKVTKSRLRYNTSNAKTKDGKKTGMIIFNELHAYENYKQLNVFTSGLGKVKHARIWTITTNGTVREGPLDEKISLSESIINGEHNLTRMLPFMNRINEKLIGIPMQKYLITKNAKDIDTTFWEQANPSLRYMPVLRQQIIDDYIKMLSTPSYKTEFYSKRMNRPMQNDDEVAVEWSNIKKALYSDGKTFRRIPEVTYPPAVIGIDFADYKDFASVGWLILVDGEYVWRQRTYICEKSPFLGSIKFSFDLIGTDGYNDFEIVKGERLDERLVIQWALDAMDWLDVKKIVMDNWQFKLLKTGFEEFGIMQETKTNPFGKVRLLTNYNSAVAIALPDIEKAFIDGSINFGDSRIMAWYTNNTKAVYQKNRGRVYDKIEPKLRKNDGFMAFVAAMTGREELKESVVYI